MVTVEQNKPEGITVIVPKPEEMTQERYLTLVARLERIVDQLGGTLHVRQKD